LIPAAEVRILEGQPSSIINSVCYVQTHQRKTNFL
jgi:hypothetical protein